MLDKYLLQRTKSIVSPRENTYLRNRIYVTSSITKTYEYFVFHLCEVASLYEKFFDSLIILYNKLVKYNGALCALTKHNIYKPSLFFRVKRWIFSFCLNSRKK